MNKDMTQPAFANVAAAPKAIGRGHLARKADCKPKSPHNSQKEF